MKRQRTRLIVSKESNLSFDPKTITPASITPIFVGIDPGATGAICAIDQNMEVIDLQDYPGNEFLCAKIIKDYCSWWDKDKYKIFAALENVHAMPGQGVTSMFTFGENFGVWKGCLASYNISFLRPTPQKWMKGLIFKNRYKKNDSKKEDARAKAQAHLAAAIQIFPDNRSHFSGPRGGIKTDRCAAALIAYWRRQQYYKGG